MILRWIRSLVSTTEAQDVSQGVTAHVRKKKVKAEELVDIAHEALRSDASDLDELLNVGGTQISERKLKDKIRLKVKKNISKEFDEPEIVEEVTERILNAVEFDPHYRELFSDEA